MGCISLSTEMNSKGDVLLAYIIDPFQRDKTEPVSSSHTHHIESLLIARSFLELGYNVDVIDYRNRHFIPIKAYTFFVSARVFLEVIASRLNPDCTVIAHLDTSHFLANNHAAYARAVALRSRRGVSCPSIRVIEHNKAIEAALYGVVLGNKVTMDTYKYANKKLYSLPIPSPLSFPFPEKDYGECRRHFMWFGSSGFVHKGLDLVLEAFSKMPDLHLHVCGPINEDTDFCNAFRNELFHTPNIHTIGWVSVDSPDFLKITRKCIALVYPSCAEGQAGSVVMCLHAGVIPMVSRESGLDVEDFGVVLDKCNIDEISLQVRHITTLPEHDLEQLTRNAWSYSNSTHTEDNYLMTYQNIIMDIISIGKLK
jgi:glycosyltransferase involved in cell wall biosynthesis